MGCASNTVEVYYYREVIVLPAIKNEIPIP